MGTIPKCKMHFLVGPSMRTCPKKHGYCNIFTDDEQCSQPNTMNLALGDGLYHPWNCDIGDGVWPCAPGALKSWRAMIGIAVVLTENMVPQNPMLSRHFPSWICNDLGINPPVPHEIHCVPIVSYVPPCFPTFFSNVSMLFPTCFPTFSPDFPMFSLVFPHSPFNFPCFLHIFLYFPSFPYVIPHVSCRSCSCASSPMVRGAIVWAAAGPGALAVERLSKRFINHQQF